MDELERRLIARIDVIDAFRLKVVGGAMAMSFIISTLFHILGK